MAFLSVFFLCGEGLELGVGLGLGLWGHGYVDGVIYDISFGLVDDAVDFLGLFEDVFLL